MSCSTTFTCDACGTEESAGHGSLLGWIAITIKRSGDDDEIAYDLCSEACAKRTLRAVAQSYTEPPTLERPQ